MYIIAVEGKEKEGAYSVVDDVEDLIPFIVYDRI